jgi:hypothetical protein
LLGKDGWFKLTVTEEKAKKAKIASFQMLRQQQCKKIMP